MKRSRLGALIAAALVTASASWAAPARIVVVRSRPLSAYDAAQQGFLSTVGQVQVHATYALTGDPQVTRRVISQIKGSPPDLVLALGTEAAAEVGSALGGIPVVFAMVVDPVQSRLLSSPARPGGSMTGVTLAVPPSEVLRALKRALPGAKSVGVIYDPAQSQRAVQELTDAARGLGLRVVTRSVGSAAEVPRAAEDLRGKMDVLYAPVDSTVYSPQSAKFVLLFALRSGIPVVGFSANLVEAGALLAVYPDYADVGRQAGSMARRILSGEAAGGIPVSAPRQARLAINLSVARTLGVSIPQTVKKSADLVFK